MLRKYLIITCKKIVVVEKSELVNMWLLNVSTKLVAKWYHYHATSFLWKLKLNKEDNGISY